MQVVLIGQIGSGKTSLYNRITNSNEVTGYGGKSITISVFSKYAAYGNVAFKVLDTPGFGCLERKIYHYAGIIAALTEAPVTRILLVVKLDRIENIWKFVLPILAPLNRFKHLISIVITHWDLCEDKDRDRQLIEQKFGEKNIQSFIYTSKDEDPKIICENIINEFQKSQPEVIKFMESELVTQFDLIEFKDEFEFEIELCKGEIAKKFQQKAQALKKYISEFDLPDLKKRYDIYLNEMKEERALLQINFDFFSKQMPEIPKPEYEFCEILHQLTLETIKIAKDFIKDFQDKQPTLINSIIQEHGQHYQFLVQALLKKELQSHLNEILEMTQTKMRKVQGHCFNNIRKCNHCGQIWIKDVGCQGKTFCGAAQKQEQGSQSYRMKNIVIIWDDMKNTITVVKKTQSFSSQQKLNHFQQHQEKQVSLKEAANEQFVDRKIKIGCGQPIEWNEMQELTEGELKELADPDLCAFLCEEDKVITAQAESQYQPFLSSLYGAIQNQKQEMSQIQK